MRVSVLQFLKSPEFAPVKTRMQPRLSTAQCLRLHCNLAQYVATAINPNAAQSSFEFGCELWSSHGGAFAESLAHRLEWHHDVQCEGDLGQRLSFALTQALNRAQVVIIVGSDCPFINADYVMRAARALQDNDVVLGPASDGGYVLLGLKAAHMALFEGIGWGSEHVLSQTIARVDRLGLSYAKLPVLSDIDRPEDLALLATPSYCHLLDGVRDNGLKR